jgi:hypothetical protein
VFCSVFCSCASRGCEERGQRCARDMFISLEFNRAVVLIDHVYVSSATRQDSFQQSANCVRSRSYADVFHSIAAVSASQSKCFSSRM